MSDTLSQNYQALMRRVLTLRAEIQNRFSECETEVLFPDPDVLTLNGNKEHNFESRLKVA
jgi:uncharacterized protein YdhG (YjbR/CyaY superfamily)